MADQDITRRILDEIDRDSSISQKKLAEEIGISVGMINWHVKRCVAKGLIKLQQAPVHRYLYYLTSRGFAEKARLTASYLQAGFGIFRRAQEHYDALLSRCAAEGWNRIVLMGDTELTELALLVSANFEKINIAGIYDDAATTRSRRGLPVIRTVAEWNATVGDQPIDALVVCHYPVSPKEQARVADLLDRLPMDRSRYLVPSFLQ